MLKEIYCRNVNDPGFLPGIIETDSALEAILTKIRMIIFTKKGEVLGEPNFGLNLEDQLFEFSFNETQIKKDFYAQLANYVPDTRNIPVDIKVKFEEGTVRDIAYIDIYLNSKKYLGIVAK
jgi:phage baseplate assembly protein W